MAQDQQQYHIRPAYGEDDEIQIGTFFKGVNETIWFIIKRWYIVLLFVAIFCGLGAMYSIWYGKKYIATSSFGVEGQSASSSLLSSAMSLANALGIQTSTSKGNTYNNNFFATLIESRKVIKESLMTEGVMNGKKDLMANHYITLYKWREGSLLHKGWNKSPGLKDFYFKKKPLDQFTPLEDSISNIIYKSIVDNNIEIIYDESTPFNIGIFTTRNRDYSMNMLKILLDKAASYYMENVYALNQKNMRIAEFRVDSLGRELKKFDYRVASLRDQSNNTIRQKGLLNVNNAAREQTLLNAQYSAAVNNVELARVTILTSVPVLQIIDDPAYSTEVSFVNMTIAIIVGLFLGIFFGSIYLFVRRAINVSNEKIKNKLAQQQNNSGTAAA
ncbi:MAG: hypothetical protein LH473_04995 [Chitinophagales bacterium]|nr:hypothetical protein [Chitinophagales bacterium]